MRCCDKYLFWSEALFEVREMEQTGDGQHIGPDVHEHEEKEACGVEGGQLGVVLQNLAQQRGNLQQHKLYICI